MFTFLFKINVDIQLVGSCSTLVTEHLLRENYKDAFGLSLLRNTIIVDTVNLSKTAKKATPQDESALQKIESILDLNDTSRQTMLDEINAAKNSIEGFTPDQLMRKDLKVSNNFFGKSFELLEFFFTDNSDNGRYTGCCTINCNVG